MSANELHPSMRTRKTHGTLVVVPGRIFVGNAFFELDEAKQTELLGSSDNLVFCRAEPSDKQRLLRQLQTMGEVGYVVIDIEADYSRDVRAALANIEGTIRTRVLY